MKFRIIGNGAFGLALAKLFGEYSIVEDSLHNEFDVINENDYLLLAVPSDVLVLVLKKVLKFGRPKCLIIVSKGLFNEKLLLDNLKNYNIPLVYLAGPNLAKEMMCSLEFLSITLAGEKKYTSEIKRYLENIIVDETQDVVLPQVAAILKNTTAFVIGFLNINQNARATLIMQGMKEAIKLAKYLGSDEKDFMLACFGDFVLTCTSLDSRNYQAGMNFKNGLKNETQESLKSVESIKALVQDLELPIFEFFYKIVNHLNYDADLLIQQIKEY